MTAKKYELMKLPYSDTDLQPYITSETISYHYGKHHRTYLDNLNKLLDGLDEQSDLKNKNLIEIVIESHRKQNLIGIFNNSAQVLNHDFYWLSMKPKGGGLPSNQGLIQKINESFGSFEQFKLDFVKGGLGQFGSGWVWLVQDNKTGKLMITKTGNADNPILYDQTPLMTCDVWEHAYYIDYRNQRGKYIETFLEELVNWDFAANNLLK